MLGLYVCKSSKWADLAKLGADVALGSWRNNPDVEMHKASEVTIRRAFHELRPLWASVDGELMRFRGLVKIAIIPRALKVLVPIQSDGR